MFNMDGRTQARQIIAFNSSPEVLTSQTFKDFIFDTAKWLF